MTSVVRPRRIADAVVNLSAGTSPSCDVEPPGPEDYGVLTVAAVTSGRVARGNAKRIEASRVRPDWPVVRRGTILVNRANGSRDLVGACVLVEEDNERLILPDKVWSLEVDQRRSPRMLIEFLRSAAGRKAIHKITRGSSGMWNIPQDAFLSIPYPNLPEQLERSFDDVAQSLDKTVGLLGREIAAKRTFKRGLMQQLLTGQKRFPAFRGRPYEIRRFDHFCEELSELNGNELGPDRVMGVIKGIGFEPMRDRVRGKGDLARYKIVPPRAFAYNPMRLNIGSIAYNELGRAILVSPDYEVFRTRVDVADPDYVNQLRYSAYWSSFMDRAGSGSVRVRIYFQDLARLRVPAPAIGEQTQIAKVLGLADSEITLLEALRDQIDLHKRALLSKLLSGEIPLPA
jgi:type I restriction enzyme S subunit